MSGKEASSSTPPLPAKVLFVTHTAEWIGPNASLVQLVKHCPDRIQAIVVSPDEGPLQSELSRHEIPCLTAGRLDRNAIPRLASLIKDENIDLVYGNSTHGASRNALIAAKIARRPFVYHLREMADRAKLRTTAFLRFADAVIAVSTATAESYRAFLREPATVVYNGVPEEFFAEQEPGTRHRIRDEFSIPTDAPVVIHVGNVNPRKAQAVAVEAFHQLARDWAEARLLLVGRLDRDPEYVHHLQNTIRATDDSGHLHLTGFRSDVRDLLAASDVFLHTATSDPHPRAVIEAMATGLPVVAVAVDGVEETVVEGVSGLLVDPPGDPAELARNLNRVLKDPELSSRMASSARNRAMEHYSSQNTAAQIIHVIDRALRRKAR